MIENTVYHNSLKRSVLIPLVIAGVMWAVFGWEQLYHISLNSYGIYPRDFIGLRGIVLSPFIHGDYSHIINNTYPVLILGTAIFYFYKKSAKYVLVYSLFMTGIWVWAMARSSFHIGASGLIYAWAAFLLASGVINKNKRMMGLSLLVVFLYGSLVWGILPIENGVSWESHLFGTIAGLILAYVFKKDGPQRKTFKWEEEEEEYEIEFWNMTPQEINEYFHKKRQEKTSSQKLEVPFKYIYKSKEEA